MAKHKTIEERQVFCILKLRIFEVLFSPHCLLHNASNILDILVHVYCATPGHKNCLIYSADITDRLCKYYDS
jgi:hypothetical protein